MDRFNRLWLLLLGAGLVAGATAVLLTASGLHDDLGLLVLRPPRLLLQDLEGAFQRDPLLWWSVLLAGLVLLAAIATWLLVLQVARRRVPRVHEVVLERGATGRTAVEATAVAGAVERDLARIEGVASSRVRLVETEPVPRLLVDLDLRDDVTPSVVREQAEGAYANLCTALGADAVDADLRIGFSDVAPPRVR